MEIRPWHFVVAIVPGWMNRDRDATIDRRV